ncbi:MAG TPA: Hsp20/alpha crystallin family protein [Candidatus Krumholzibacteria bacterium]|nr:Hsp20/alpha crystallin family protein [Candidatus Krumholzibacteria bacterium]
MKLIKRENQMTPYLSPIDALFERLNCGLPAFGRAFSDFENETNQLATRLPRTNVQETDNAYILTLEMPGLSKEDVDVNFEDDTIVIKGEKSETKEEKDVVRREYHSARFERSFNVHGINRDQVSAKMENGILSVTLPKSADRLGRKIDVA